jgi:hypothetical protein
MTRQFELQIMVKCDHDDHHTFVFQLIVGFLLVECMILEFIQGGEAVFKFNVQNIAKRGGKTLWDGDKLANKWRLFTYE